jgi:hypothetical protein
MINSNDFFMVGESGQEKSNKKYKIENAYYKNKKIRKTKNI